MNKDNNIVVSICCQTFNHKDYITETLEGFLMQKTDFLFEILLRDDASTDGTADICYRYANKYPNKIKLLAYDENQWNKGVSPFRDNVKRVNGKYITMCEGDDYWIDPYKLQKQVDFLESNLDYGLVHTEFNVYYEHSNETIVNMNKSNSFDYSKVSNDFAQLLNKNHVATCTVMFRKELYDQLNLNEISKYSHGDLVMWLEMSQKAKFKYFDSSTSVYRVRGESMSNSNSKLKRLGFLIGSKKIKMDYSVKYGTESQIKHASYEYYSRVLNKAIYDKDKPKASDAFKCLPFRKKRDYLFYLFSRAKVLNTLFLSIQKKS